ncbi:MAG: 3-phosphoshikimate 1-carboxyvinyltransferase [Chitinispirillales bacterium]|jgi:3-phosphoshikimate 1-carboxyvinyltransferase|nr:3-phosphoshikimate 1-carboxyvinyltransferase [Chitinispirillales bacterium]
MKWIVRPSKLSGAIHIPPSKSHTVRAFLISALANGESVIKRPLIKGDGESALKAAVSLGARAEVRGEDVYVKGTGGDFNQGSNFFDMGNSGTGLNLFCAAAALGSKARRFDGDASLRSRPMKPVMNALRELGANITVESGTQDLPFVINGPLRGGHVSVDGISSQFVSTLLLSAPLAKRDTHITVYNIHEKPYIEMTLWWLEKQGIELEYSNDFTSYQIRGSQMYRPFDMRVPADFSSAAFSAVSGAIGNAPVELAGLDFSDPQGDKKIFDVLASMGANITYCEGTVKVCGGNLHGAVIDLNSMPDALPALSVAAACAKGETIFTNVAQARIKETDRIAVMVKELTKMGIEAVELPDGMAIQGGTLKGAHVNGRNDHRVVMALAIAGMNASGETVIDTAEAAQVTYPTFAEDYRSLGADITVQLC